MEIIMKRKTGDAFGMRSVFLQPPLAIHNPLVTSIKFPGHSTSWCLYCEWRSMAVFLKLWAALPTLRDVACRKNARPHLSLSPSLCPSGSLLWVGQNMDSLTHNTTICTAWFSPFQINCFINFLAKKEKKSWPLARVNGILLSDFVACNEPSFYPVLICRAP
jgi:hypothetical protein|uniref:Uncharacterized protein n=1 Tax=Mus musculus TaxID=10090 RepID=Q8BS55_MOUSE|nr:unnamed protein product [Mus musculus]